MTEKFTSNIAFAGLTAAGKTTHSRRVAAELGYDYVSANELLLDLLGVDTPGNQVWFTRLHEIQAARATGAVDAQLEECLIFLNRTRQRTVFDTWALAWIGDSPLARIWIESNLESRVRKCVVSQGSGQLSPDECRTLIRNKDEFNRRLFRQRHGFDLFTERSRYDAIVCNSHLIPAATAASANSGIETFAPVVREVITCVLKADESAARRLQEIRSKEIHRITVPDETLR